MKSPTHRRGGKGAAALNGLELDLKFNFVSSVQYMAFLVAIVQLIRWVAVLGATCA
jgi:hypothetical protein